MVTAASRINGINIAFRVQGEGPPLVLIMGYRLSSAAWPAKFVEALAENFTVVTFDNRGTGQSDKPLTGYALANMARDVAGLLDEIGIESTYLLGYSMGGAIAQEFTRQFPERVAGLILCATMCGGPRATYAEASVVRVMRDLDGFSPEQIARRIWAVTYAPNYLSENREQAEDQMRREIALPTPLHAADLQFQAFAEFDGSKALPQIRCPTLVMTGDLDRLIRPENSGMLAQTYSGSKAPRHSRRRASRPVGGRRGMYRLDHRVSRVHTRPTRPHSAGSERSGRRLPPRHTRWYLRLNCWQRCRWLSQGPGANSLKLAWQSPLLGSFGDGKPIVILAPHFVGSDLIVLPFSIWLKALGYRPVTAGGSMSLDNSAGDRHLAQVISDITRRVRRKAILIAHSSGMTRALRAAAAHRDSISDVIIFDASHRPHTDGLRVHYVSSGWPLLHGMVELPRLLRSIGIELV